MKNAVIHSNSLRLRIFIVIYIGIAMPTAIGAEELPSMEFLEYLGEWETKDGEWIDPTMLADNEEMKPLEVDVVSTVEEQRDEP